MIVRNGQQTIFNGQIVSSSAQLTGSLGVSGPVTASSILSTGNIVAQTLVVSTISSSVSYSSGSNIFGNSPSNVQQFTGSLRVTGSGNHWIIGGNVGINTTTPTSAKLVVSDFTSAPSSASILDLKNSSDGGLKILFSNSVTTELASITAGVTSAGAGTDDGVLIFSTATNGASSERVRITSDGNVGINNTSPAYKLDVTGQSRIGFDVTPTAPSATDILSTAHTIHGGNGGNYLTFGQYDSSKNYAQWIQSSYSNPTTATYNLVLNPLGGNVGIGTASPTSSKLVISYASTTIDGLSFVNTAASGREWRVGDGAGLSPGNFGIYDATAATVRTIITSGGNVGIGTTSPISATGYTGFTVYNAVSGGIIQSTNGTVDTRMQISANVGYAGVFSNHDFGLVTNATEKVRITSGGNVGIGTTSPTTKLSVTDSSYNQYSLRLESQSSNTANRWGGIGFAGEVNNTKAAILFVSDGTSYSRGNLVFSLNNGADQTNADLTTERMRITSAGSVGIGTTSTSTEGNLFLGAKGTDEGGQLVLQRGTSYTYACHIDVYQQQMRFLYGNDTGSTGVLATIDMPSGNVTATAYYETSDQRLKTEIIDYTSNELAGIKAKAYKKNDEFEIGYLAQDVKEVMPELVKENQDGYLTISYKSIHTAKIAALEEMVKKQQEEINLLKSLIYKA